MGAIVLASMSGFMLALLMFPGPLPQSVWGERRAGVADEAEDAEATDVNGAAARPLRARTVAATRVRRDMAQPSRARAGHGTAQRTAGRTAGLAATDPTHRRRSTSR
ncbi:MAG TPA: hypothetical protein VFA94_01375, partial [Acidimicrobiales bacterium]|nr:hypothetical protein [Acidimicrobiales bacterium]